MLTGRITGHIMEELNFLKGSYTILENYNLKGLKLTSIALPWKPFLTIDECDENGTNCEIHYGYIKDYMDTLSKDLNFTYVSYLEQGSGHFKFSSCITMREQRYWL